MKFETQIQSGGNGGSDVTPEQWQAWNEYQWSLFEVEEVQSKNNKGAVIPNTYTKSLTQVGIANFFLDCGLQPQPDSDYDSKLEAGTEDGQKGHGVEGMPEGYSEAEKAHVRKYPDNYFKTVDGKRKQFKPERPTQEIYVAFDVPNIVIDWTKHPLESMHKLGQKPLRISFNGYYARRNDKKEVVWEGFGKSLRFNPNWQTGKLSPNNPIQKLANNLDLGDVFENSGYDFDKLLGGALNLNFEVRCKRKDSGDLDRMYPAQLKSTSRIVDLNIPSVGKVTREQQIPECDITPVSVMLSQETFDPQILEIISNKRELKAVLPKATSFQPNAVKAPDFWLGVNWEDTNLCKALGGLGEQSGQQASQKPSQGSSPSGTQTPAQESKPSQSEAQKPQQQYNEPPMDFEDDIPF